MKTRYLIKLRPRWLFVRSSDYFVKALSSVHCRERRSFSTQLPWIEITVLWKLLISLRSPKLSVFLYMKVVTVNLSLCVLYHTGVVTKLFILE